MKKFGLLKVLSMALVGLLSLACLFGCNNPNSGNKTPSKGLRYEVNADGETCTITGIGTCTDAYLVIPSEIDGYTVTKIGLNAFRDNLGIKSVTLGDKLEEIGPMAFQDCTALTSFTISDSVTKILDFAFMGCTSLTSIEIPRSVTTLGAEVFGACTSLTEIKVDSQNPNYCSVNGNLYNKDITEIIAYASGKSDKSFTVPATVKVIGNGAFRNSQNLESVQLPSNLEAISQHAFSGCENLNTLNIPESVKRIEYGVFRDCSSLKIVLHAGLTFISENVIMSVNRVYYHGNIDDFTAVLGDSTGRDLAIVLQRTFYYSEVEPTDERNYWHYDNNGNVVEWQ